METKNLLDPSVYYKVSITLYTAIYTEDKKVKTMESYKKFLQEVKLFLSELGFTARTIQKDFVFLKGSFEQFVLSADELIGFVRRSTINQIKNKAKEDDYEMFEIEEVEELYETRNYTFLEYFNTLQETHLQLYKHVEPDGEYYNNPFALFPDFNYHNQEIPKSHKKLFLEEVEYIKNIKNKK